MASFIELGMPIERAELFGKPHLLMYDGDYHYCAICGRICNNKHHMAIKGMGGGSEAIEIAGVKVESALVSVCGMGNTGGCHGRFHRYEIVPKWHWNEPWMREEWFAGVFFTDYGIHPYDQRLYRFGCWGMEMDGMERIFDGNCR